MTLGWGPRSRLGESRPRIELPGTAVCWSDQGSLVSRVLNQGSNRGHLCRQRCAISVWMHGRWHVHGGAIHCASFGCTHLRRAVCMTASSAPGATRELSVLLRVSACDRCSAIACVRFCSGRGSRSRRALSTISIVISAPCTGAPALLTRTVI